METVQIALFSKTEEEEAELCGWMMILSGDERAHGHHGGKKREANFLVESSCKQAQRWTPAEGYYGAPLFERKKKGMILALPPTDAEAHPPPGARRAYSAAPEVALLSNVLSTLWFSSILSYAVLFSTITPPTWFFKRKRIFSALRRFHIATILCVCIHIYHLYMALLNCCIQGFKMYSN